MNNQFIELVRELNRTRAVLVGQALERKNTIVSLREEAQLAQSFFQSIGYPGLREDNGFEKCAKELEKIEDKILDTEAIDGFLEEVMRGGSPSNNTSNDVDLLDKIMKNQELKAYHYDAALTMIAWVDYRADVASDEEEMLAYLAEANSLLQNMLGEQGKEDEKRLVQDQCDSTTTKLRISLQYKDMEHYVKKLLYMKMAPAGYYVASDGIKDHIQPYLRSKIKECKTVLSPEAIQEFMDTESTKWFQENRALCDKAKTDGYRDSAKRRYEKLAADRAKEIKSIPPEAAKKYTDLALYQKRVKREYLDWDLYKDLIAEAAEKCTYQIEDKAQILFARADEKLKKDIAAEVALMREREHEAKEEAKNREKELKKEAAREKKQEKKEERREEGIRGFLRRGLFWYIGITFGLWLVLTGISKLTPDKGPDRERVSEEVWWEYLEKTLGEDIAEVSPTATPADKFEYEVLSRPHLNMIEGKTSCTYSYTGVVIKRYLGTDTKVEIPAVIEGVNVCEIGAGAFADNIYLEEVIIPDTVNTIRADAFARCAKLKTLVCSDNIAIIEKYAFGGCSALTSFVAEGGTLSMKYIGECAFEGCSNLQNVKMNINCDADIELKLERGAFAECTSLQEISIQGASLKNIIVREEAFTGCRALKRVDFWDKITSLGARAFGWCESLESASLPALAEQMIPGEVFKNCLGLTSFHVTANLKGIDKGAFADCTNLQTVTFEQLPAGELGAGYGMLDYAFVNTAISEIEIPGNYDYLGVGVFENCGNLSKVVWHGNNKNTLSQQMSDWVFGGCTSLTAVYLPRTMDWISQNWDFSLMPNVTIYAYEGSRGHEYAVNMGVNWQNWTE